MPAPGRQVRSCPASGRWAAEQGGRNFEAERVCRVEVDHQLELGRLHDRKVRGLRALEDASGVDAG